MNNTTVVLSLSGGLDSATLLADLLSRKANVICVGFNYGSKHNEYENVAAEKLAKHYDVPYSLIDITSALKLFKSDLLKTGNEIPEGHYSDQSMSRTVVPSRNMIMLSILTGYAQSIMADTVAIGVHQGDHAIYPDCRPDFICCMGAAIIHASEKKINLIAPFIEWHKAAIVRRGLELGVPFQLTRTCYKDQSIACGVCGSCNERIEAFEKNNAVDPTFNLEGAE